MEELKRLVPARRAIAIQRAIGLCLLLGIPGGARAEPAGQRSLPPSHAEITAARLKGALLDSRGHPVVLNVWATWCIPCRKEFPHLTALQKEFGPEGIRFFAVSVDTAAAYETHARPFLAELGVPFPTWRKADGDDEAFINALDASWQGDLPAVFLFSREGGLLKRLAGEQSPEDLRREISALLP